MAETVQQTFAPVEKKPYQRHRKAKPGFVKTYTPKPVHILSMGAGVQTTAMLIKYGPQKRYDYIVFADTRDEEPETYKYIEKYLKPFCKEIGLPWITVGNLNGEGIYDYYMRIEDLPNRTTRQCTRDFKIRPIHRFAKSIGCTENNPMLCDIGFTMDESHRLNDSKKKEHLEVDYVKKVYPFLHEEKITRQECLTIIKEHGWPEPVKSGCDFCMYKSRSAFRRLAVERPERFAQIVALEKNDSKYPKFPLDGRVVLEDILKNATLDAEKVPDVDNMDCDTGHCMT